MHSPLCRGLAGRSWFWSSVNGGATLTPPRWTWGSRGPFRPFCQANAGPRAFSDVFVAGETPQPSAAQIPPTAWEVIDHCNRKVVFRLMSSSPTSRVGGRGESRWRLHGGPTARAFFFSED